MQTPGKRVFSASGVGKAAATRAARKHAHDCSRTYLDHTSFPHIARGIFSHLARPELLTLRATSTEYLDFADARLFHHVVAAMPAGRARGRDIELRAPHTPFPRLPFLPWQSAEPPGARRAVRQQARQRQLAIVRVVDFGDSRENCPRHFIRDVTEDTGNVLHEFYDDGFDDATTGENTLRSTSRLIAPLLRLPLIVRRRNALAGAACAWIPADTYVDYICIEEPAHEAHWFWPTASIEVPPCRTYVLHLAYDPYVPMSMADIKIKVPEGIAAIVIVMAPSRFDGPTSSTPGRPLRLGGILASLLTGFLCNMPTARLQIVGLENVHRSTLGLELAESRPEDTLRAARASIPEFIHAPRDFAAGFAPWQHGIHTGAQRTLEFDSFEHQLDTLSRISMPTFDEWEASLPDEERPLLAHPPEFESVAR